MDEEDAQKDKAEPAASRSSGPLRIYRDENNELFVTGFGLWIPVRTEKEGTLLIEELEDQGYRICY
ncbi:MAG: hypothetical protein HY913_21485 [Desulfomonile tiedjei]|nr:hypothetical protein [Desulfomonile tiedjei]